MKQSKDSEKGAYYFLYITDSTCSCLPQSSFLDHSIIILISPQSLLSPMANLGYKSAIDDISINLCNVYPFLFQYNFLTVITISLCSSLFLVSPYLLVIISCPYLANFIPTLYTYYIHLPICYI